MARAKQTKRAEARRRYRQALGQSGDETSVTEASEPSGGSTGGSTGGSAGSARSNGGASGRPGLGAAFRTAYHPAHLLEDLRALPGLLTAATPARLPFTRTVIGIPWFLVSAFLVIAGFIALLTSPTTIASGIPTASPLASVVTTAAPSGLATAAPTLNPSPAASPTASGPSASGAAETPAPSGAGASGAQGSGGLGAFIFQLLALPPGGPTLPVLLVGFMATRASYLQGFLIGLLDLVLVGIWIAFVPTAAPPSGTSVSDILISYAVTGLPTSVLFAAAAAWYRRFLAASSPKRVAPARTGGARTRPNTRSAGRR